jgi:hypothetical protein
MAARLEAATK